MNSVISNEEIASQFPILKQPIHQDKCLVYLDSAATAQKPLVVIQSMNAFYEHTNANIHRGIHALAEAATEAYENARAKTARFIGVQDARQLVFTRNTTESINLIAYTWGRKFLNKGDLIVLTEMEHHSNLVPWYVLAEEKELRIEFVRVQDDGTLDMRHYHDLLEKKPRLVAFTHMSNVLGTINPAKEMIQDAHTASAVVVVDGAQAVPHFSVNLTDLEPDFYAFSGHKMCGPTGIGMLYGKLDLLNAMPPFLGGGDMIKKVTFEGFSTNDVPYKFEAGTPAIAEGIGMGAAVDFLESVGMDAVFAHEQELTQYAFNVLADVKGLRIIGPGADVRGGVVSFTLEGIHPHDVAQILDSEGIAVRAGHHCAMPLHQRFNLPATTRASLYLYNTRADLDALRTGLDKVIEIFAQEVAMDDFYREIILEHYKNPAFKGKLESSDYEFEDENPLCGDHLHIELKTDDKGVITDAKFDGHGCAISMASADMLLETLIGKTIEDVKQLSKQDILDLLGIELSPVRLKCALLSLKVAKAAAYEMEEAHDDLVE